MANAKAEFKRMTIFDGFTNATMSAREFARQITQIQSNKEKPMYRVKTNLLSEYQQGETITDRQQLELLQSGCPQDWFEKIRVKEGQYWEDEDGTVFRVMEKYNGFRSYPDWTLKHIGRNVNWHATTEALTKTARKLSNNEIQQALTEEAKRRGLVKGKEIKSARTGEEYLWGNNAVVRYNANTDELIAQGAHGDYFGGSAIVLYKQGEFAEIVDQTPDVVINRWKVEFKQKYVKVGCKDISPHKFKGWAKDAEEFGLRFHRKGEDITDQIKQIAEYYE